MKNEIISVDSSKWLVREAKSMNDALNAVAMARCTGSVGSKQIEEYNGAKTILADVVRLNDDGTERKPYGA